MDYNLLLDEIYQEIKHHKNEGNVASYIPELENVKKNSYGVSLKFINGKAYNYGDYAKQFSMQSIVKVLTLTKAFSLVGNQIWERVDVEPSGNPYNSLIQLEIEEGIPRNPFINSGAIVISDILLSVLKNPEKDFLSFVRLLANDQEEKINYNLKVASSEKETGYRNIAVGNFLKSFGNIKNNVEDVLDFYFLSCSIEITCNQLAEIFTVFANKGKLCHNNQEILTLSQTKRINAIMQTCGFYDESGEFSFEVGLPGKSGVGGGIVAVHPGDYAIAVWSPKLNKKGNSVMGMKSLELFTTKTGHSIF